MVFVTFDMSLASMGPARQRKNIPKFLGETIIPSPDSLGQMGGSLPSVGPGPDRWKNRAASRFSVLFSSNAGAGSPDKEVDRLEQLQSKLHSYSKYGLPKVPRQLAFHQDSWEEEEGEANLILEDSWQVLLDNPETLTRRQFHQQEAIWELLHTEAAYIKKLRVITDLFLCGLLNLQESGLLMEVEPTKMFSNIQEIVRLHTALWNQVMLPVVQKAREARALLDPTHLHDGFRTFASRFQPYIRYCMEEESCMEYMRTLHRDNELFRTYITWAETNKQCNRLKMADMLAKPHQRLTKYPLLLKSILKKTDELAVRDIVNSMVVTVEGFINSVDAQMRQRQEQQKLATISARIDTYEAVEGSSEEVEKILKEYNRFDLMAPMRGTSPEQTRQLQLEGALRMKEGKDSRMDVYCFLFTDLLLITKPVKRVEKVKVIRQPLLIHNVVCKELKDTGSFILIYLNEFKSAVAAYTFQANSATQGRSWIEAICNVQNQLQRLRNEEDLRQQDVLKRCTEAEDEVEDESSNSTTSSPILRHKEQQNLSTSDGSTETLSVMDVDEPADQQPPDKSQETGDDKDLQPDSSSLLETSDVQPSQLTLSSQEAEELDPQVRSLSMDSAYGTLSPGSLQQQPEEEEDTEGEQQQEDEEEEEEEQRNDKEERGDTETEEEDEEESAPSGSQQSVLQSCKPRRRPHIRAKLQCPQRLSALTALTASRSEDCLLQHLHDQTPAHFHTHPPRSQRGDALQSPLGHSKSLSELRPDSGALSCPLGSEEATATGELKGSQSHADQLEFVGCNSDSETAPPGCLEKTIEGSSGLGETPPTKRKPPQQQHKKLTLAQLYRMRTTLVLNSTLTASEV